MDDKFNLSNLPPMKHVDVAEFAANLFEIARADRDDRLKKPDDWLESFNLYSGVDQNKRKQLVNLYFSNIERTVSNITARNPSGEVVDLDGKDDGSEKIWTAALRKWHQETGQRKLNKDSARQMEINGIVIHKPVWGKKKHRPIILLADPYGFFPAPGFYEKLDEEAPFLCYVYTMYIDTIEAMFKVKHVAEDDGYELLGLKREEMIKGTGDGNSTGQIGRQTNPANEKEMAKGLVVELWVRDDQEKTVSIDQTLMDGSTQTVKETSKACPDGIRKITITRTDDPKKDVGWMVLEDVPNPNINPNLSTEEARVTHPWNRLPAYIANSYSDTVSIWGFAAASKIGRLVAAINFMLEKLAVWAHNAMFPTLIVPKPCGIRKEQIESTLQGAGRAILRPNVVNHGIVYLPTPNLPQTFFEILNLFISLLDRVYQIEDADRGEAPKGVIAASAIVALQERNQMMMESKSASIDYLEENKTRWAIGLWQNHGTTPEQLSVAGEPTVFIGAGEKFRGRQFGYAVEAGSSTPKTQLQTQEQAVDLFDKKAIDVRALLETLNFPNWKEIIERTGETQLDMALQVLIDAGLPEELAMEMKQELVQQQGGPGDAPKDKPKGDGQPKPGTPVAKQGETP